MHKIAHDYVKTAQAHTQESANRHRLLVPFTIGDKSKLKATNLRFVQQPCSKLRNRYIGPLLITEEVSPVARKFFFAVSYPMEYGFMMLHTQVYRKNGIQTRNKPTVHYDFQLCTMRSDLRSTHYSTWPSTPTALDFCSKFAGRHLSTYLARTNGSRCEESIT
jgi:hypothetical protein